MTHNPERLNAVRELRGITQTELAEITGIDQGSISRYEAGLKPMPEYDLATIAKVLDFPADFFFLPGQRYGVESGEIFHRTSRELPQTSLKKVYAQLDIIRWNMEKLLARVKPTYPYNIPIYRVREFDGDMEQVAAAVRAAWNIPPGAIHNLTERLENAFCLIYAVNFGIAPKLMDEVSQWHEPTPPIILLNNRQSGDRLRFTLAHTLGHLVMHHNLDPYHKMEEECDQFAAAFLMPKDDILPDLILQPITIERLLQLKPYWKVSMQALIQRCVDLGVITQSRQASLYRKLNREGMRKNEPFALEIEQPKSPRRILDLYRKGKSHFSANELAKLVAMPMRDFMNWHLPDEVDLELVLPSRDLKRGV